MFHVEQNAPAAKEIETVMRYIDSHCHPNNADLRGEARTVFERARAAGVLKMGAIGSDLADSAEAVQMCRDYAEYGLFAVVGVHPHEARTMPNEVAPELLELAQQPEVRAWGEIGLDYFYDFSTREQQQSCLVAQLEAAKALGKTVVFHVRDAYDDFWKLLTPELAPEHAVLHCFNGSAADAKRALDLGWMIGFTGMITFKSCQPLRDVAAGVPLSRILCETDSPYMAPVPFRGTRNEPCNVPLVYRKIAEIKDMDLDDTVEQIWQNNMRFWGFAE